MSNIYLLSVRLVNIQSWKDTTVNFTTGLNVLKAPNQTGKSVLFKVLHFIMNPRSVRNRRDLIRFSEPYARVFLTFSDGLLYIIQFTDNAIAYFEFQQGYDKPRVVSTTGPTESLISHLGCALRGDILSNVIEMDEVKFLINSTSRENADLIDLVTVHPRLEELIQNLEENIIPQNKKLLSDVTMETNLIKREMDSCGYEETYTLQQEIKDSIPRLLLARRLLNVLKSCRIKEPRLDISKFNLPMLQTLEFLSLSLQKEIKAPIAVAGTIADFLSTLESVVQITTSKLKQPLNVPRSIASSLHLLSLYSSLLHYQLRHPIYAEVSCQELKILELLSSVISARIKPVKELPPRLSQDMLICETLSGLLSLLDSIISESRIESVRNEGTNLLKSIGGVTVSGCPLHGTVIATGKECIPCSE